MDTAEQFGVSAELGNGLPDGMEDCSRVPGRLPRSFPCLDTTSGGGRERPILEMGDVDSW